MVPHQRHVSWQWAYLLWTSALFQTISSYLKTSDYKSTLLFCRHWLIILCQDHCQAFSSMKLGKRDQRPPLSAPAINQPSFKPNIPFELKLLQGGAPNLSAPIHVGQSAGLCKFPQTGYIRDGTIRQREESEGWRCWRRVQWIRREILPVADSDGANSSTKDRPEVNLALYLSFLESGTVFLYLFLPLHASHCFLASILALCHFFLFFFLSFAVIKTDGSGHEIEKLFAQIDLMSLRTRAFS